ncbi:MAG: ATP-binding cassette domain-containing protein [Porticoccaceae bacterium]
MQLCAGEIVQLAGANGAGKTSLMRSLVGLPAATKGKVFMARARSGQCQCFLG